MAACTPRQHAWHGVFLLPCTALLQAHYGLAPAGVLNRAEWIKFLGLFFNQDALATTVFDGINASYYETASEIQVGLPAAGEGCQA